MACSNSHIHYIPWRLMMGFQFAAGRRQAAFNNFLMEAWRPSPRRQCWNTNSNGCRFKNTFPSCSTFYLHWYSRVFLRLFEFKFAVIHIPTLVFRKHILLLYRNAGIFEGKVIGKFYFTIVFVHFAAKEDTFYILNVLIICT